jgi:hypothetical protein
MPTVPVQGAIEILRRDLERVLIQEGNAIGQIVIELPRKQDVTDESYQIDVDESIIRISACSDLGAIYGILRISRDFLGVQPFWFWLDKMPAQQASLPVKAEVYTSQIAKARFRGWFINDEVLLEGWKPEGKPNDFVWRMAMETLLRLGGNIVIPGTDTNSRKNRRLASEMGLWISHHHSEPLGAEMFGREYPDLEASYFVHKQEYQGLWKKGIDSHDGCNVIWTLGFRGQGDRPFWYDDSRCDTPEKRGQLTNEIIREQYAMVRGKRPDAACCVHLYGETLELYRAGHLDLPKDVIFVWADNGYGKMVSRRQNNHNPRIPAVPDRNGKNGVYYHASFYDLQASNHITMLPNPPEMVCRELSGVLEAGAEDYWIINSGSIRPHCYILDLIAELWTKGNADANDHRLRFAGTYFDGDRGIAELLGRFSEHTVQYGVHEDEKAGEELFHYPVRQMAAAWMRGELNEPLDSLIWLCGEKPLSQQINDYHMLARKARESWEAYLDECGRIFQTLNGMLAQRFYDHIMLQAEIHYTGASGASLFCESYIAAMQENYPKAFVLAWKAGKTYKLAIDGFEKSEHGIWKGYYSNDCLTDVRLTVDILGKLHGWLRVLGEGSDFHMWYRRFFMDERDRRVALILCTLRPPSDDVLANELSNVIDIKDN